jgi:hypothetical protein
LLRRFLRALALSILVLPATLVGTVVNYPAYRLVGFIATGLARGDEGLVATIKILAGALFFPLTWIAVAVTIGLYRGIMLGMIALIVAPLSGYVALRFFERLDEFMGGLRALVLSRFQRWGFLRLIAERRAIREAIVRLAEEFEQ